jgi:hypothetical protein
MLGPTLLESTACLNNIITVCSVLLLLNRVSSYPSAAFAFRHGKALQFGRQKRPEVAVRPPS